MLVSQNNDLMKLIIQHVKNDLNSSNPIHVNLALQCIANIASPDMLEGVGPDVPKLLISGYVHTFLSFLDINVETFNNF